MKLNRLVFFTAGLIFFSACNSKKQPESDKLKVVCTTTMITDLVKTIGGDEIIVQGLMGAGVDPHLFKASAGDVNKLVLADLILYNGLHLEGKLVEVFEKMGAKKNTIALADCISVEDLIHSDLFASNHDPHIWFSINNWKLISTFVSEILQKNDSDNASKYEERYMDYMTQLEILDASSKEMIKSLPKEKRVLVTAHDAFGYFGKDFGFEVVGLQGLSTVTEAGVKDVQELAKLIIEKDVKAIFVESSVPQRTIESLQAAVQSKGHEVVIGGTLYSDALGDYGTVEGTYIGMFEHNLKTIVNSLK
ncbi:MAG: manganese/zinc/iron transport system substrate-binding protein [Flavobacteriales bacterium]|jgi:manganese/zinc/iron transport system substrate-binding protein